MKRVSSFLVRGKPPLVTGSTNSSNAAQAGGKADVEMGKRNYAKRNSAFLLKQEKVSKRVSMKMKKLEVTIVNAPVDRFDKKGKRKKAGNPAAAAEGKVFRNKEKIAIMITEAHEAMERAHRVKNVDGFLDVYKAAAKKCATLASVSLRSLQSQHVICK